MHTKKMMNSMFTTKNLKSVTRGVATTLGMLAFIGDAASDQRALKTCEFAEGVTFKRTQDTSRNIGLLKDMNKDKLRTFVREHKLPDGKSLVVAFDAFFASLYPMIHAPDITGEQLEAVKNHEEAYKLFEKVINSGNYHTPPGVIYDKEKITNLDYMKKHETKYEKEDADQQKEWGMNKYLELQEKAALKGFHWYNMKALNHEGTTITHEKLATVQNVIDYVKKANFFFDNRAAFSYTGAASVDRTNSLDVRRKFITETLEASCPHPESTYFLSYRNVFDQHAQDQTYKVSFMGDMFFKQYTTEYVIDCGTGQATLYRKPKGASVGAKICDAKYKRECGEKLKLKDGIFCAKTLIKDLSNAYASKNPGSPSLEEVVQGNITMCITWANKLLFKNKKDDKAGPSKNREEMDVVGKHFGANVCNFKEEYERQWTSLNAIRQLFKSEGLKEVLKQNDVQNFLSISMGNSKSHLVKGTIKFDASSSSSSSSEEEERKRQDIDIQHEDTMHRPSHSITRGGAKKRTERYSNQTTPDIDAVPGMFAPSPQPETRYNNGRVGAQNQSTQFVWGQNTGRDYGNEEPVIVNHQPYRVFGGASAPMDNKFDNDQGQDIHKQLLTEKNVTINATVRKVRESWIGKWTGNKCLNTIGKVLKGVLIDTPKHILTFGQMSSSKFASQSYKLTFKYKDGDNYNSMKVDGKQVSYLTWYCNFNNATFQDIVIDGPNNRFRLVLNGATDRWVYKTDELNRDALCDTLDSVEFNTTNLRTFLGCKRKFRRRRMMQRPVDRLTRHIEKSM